MIKHKRLLYYGQGTWGSTSVQRYNALSEIFSISYLVDSRRAFPDKGTGRSLLKSIQGRTGIGNIISITSKILLQEAQRFKPDVIWIDGGFLVSRKVLKLLAELNIILIHYTPDSLLSPGMSNLCFQQAISSYDYLVTTKKQDVDLYKKHQPKKLIMSQQGFDPDIHSHSHLTQNEIIRFSCDVVFIGHCMADRLSYMEYLVKELDIDIKIFGTGWNHGNVSPKLQQLFHGPAVDMNYSRAISGSKIALGFLNHDSKDQITTRSFEIPAAGGFFLAERTDQHIELLAESKEAAYFSSKEELVNKIKYYLEHDAERLAIQTMGTKKIRDGDYTWRSLMNSILKEASF